MEEIEKNYNLESIRKISLFKVYSDIIFYRLMSRLWMNTKEDLIWRNLFIIGSKYDNGESIAIIYTSSTNSIIGESKGEIIIGGYGKSSLILVSDICMEIEKIGRELRIDCYWYKEKIIPNIIDRTILCHQDIGYTRKKILYQKEVRILTIEGTLSKLYENQQCLSSYIQLELEQIWNISMLLKIYIAKDFFELYLNNSIENNNKKEIIRERLRYILGNPTRFPREYFITDIERVNLKHKLSLSINLNSIRILKLLSQGNQGVVFVCQLEEQRSKRSDKLYALKINYNFSSSKNPSNENYQLEEELIENGSRFICRTFSHFETELNEFNQFNEWPISKDLMPIGTRIECRLMDLHDCILSDYYQSLNRKEKMIVILQMLFGLKEMQLKRIVHRNLKMENILVLKENGLVSISGFGMAMKLEGDQMKWRYNEGEGYWGNVQRYKAPEVNVLEDKKEYNLLKVDLYSIGIITQEIFNNNSSDDKEKGNDMKLLIEKMTLENYMERLTVEESIEILQFILWGSSFKDKSEMNIEEFNMIKEREIQRICYEENNDRIRISEILELEYWLNIEYK